jgi:hypothetical protein
MSEASAARLPRLQQSVFRPSSGCRRGGRIAAEIDEEQTKRA